MPFRFTPLEIPDVILVEASVFEDARGNFAEMYKRSEFQGAGIPDTFVQDNYSRSSRGVLRGLHYQKPPRAQGKLISVLAGAVFDVAVDLREGSPTRGRWVGTTLSSKNRRLLYVPEGFAHGYCVLSDSADMLYKVTEEYAPHLDRGIAWNDPDLAIAWPVSSPVLSAKDAHLPLWRQVESDFLCSGRSA
jgi:dTDP-4-dehydrorhamnose 3,5-epimerase